MQTPIQDTIQNRLLSNLPPESFRRVAPYLEQVDLPKGRQIATAGQPIEHVYFLTAGMASVVAKTRNGNFAEAGMCGHEGFVPTSAVALVDLSPHDIGIQLAGKGYRMRYSVFRACADDRNFLIMLARAAEGFAIQLTHTAISNAIHEVPERLARWLLMCHDRNQGDDIEFTHDFLSLMLAVRRSSITTSLHILEGRGFIRAQRGLITIRDRRGLEGFAFDAYGRPEEELRRLMNLPL